jgi:hypothetical protein
MASPVYGKPRASRVADVTAHAGAQVLEMLDFSRCWHRPKGSFATLEAQRMDTGVRF